MEVNLPEGSAQLFGNALLSEIRAHFACVDSDPYNGCRVYLENAGGGFTLQAVLDVVVEAAQLPDNTGRSNSASKQIHSWMNNGYDDLMTFVGARDGVIVSGQSTTANTFRLLDVIGAQTTGSNVVCSDLDHPSSYDGTRFYAEKYGMDWRVARLDPTDGRVPASSYAEVVDGSTSVVTIIHASNLVGVKNDLRAIVDTVRSRAPEAFIIVDGAQYAQHGLIDVHNIGADAYTFSAYKTFSKPGRSFAWISPRLAELPHAKLAGNPATAWDMGTPEPGAYGAFTEVINYLCWLGLQCGCEPSASRRQQMATALAAMEAHEAVLTDHLLNGNSTCPGLLDYDAITVLGDHTVDNRRQAIVAFIIDGFSPEQIVTACRESGVIIHTRMNDAYSGHTLRALGNNGCVRVSTGHYTTPKEVGAFLKVISNLCQS